MCTQHLETRTTKSLVAMFVYLTKYDDQNSFVKKRQNGGYDVKWVRSNLFKETKDKVSIRMHFPVVQPNV